MAVFSWQYLPSYTVYEISIHLQITIATIYNKTNGLMLAFQLQLGWALRWKSGYILTPVSDIVFDEELIYFSCIVAEPFANFSCWTNLWFQLLC